eukprot:CAMPEP_0113419164 /NCGR_PEP_ID=MMETSP0013_2-20120614/26621_1 /TAXON_ID=2843 ORGANISM="Skeletonema costatum, Strain 1716" /NCGR_SAMPLE_ID=MMETSP0013_2 /ASSEMBLY_ACC=CAM_ASM_000158 /LENGTH=76 /DNA_ID=CAMNT_0000306503 /DNA_START=59 /DNA_END=286 /DNA_ORIENTATION=+ /assembly_acc=CAM_ASM_000158
MTTIITSATLLLSFLALIIDPSCAFSPVKGSAATKRTTFASSLLASISADDTELQPVRKVAIIGSGICGLSLAHAL